MPPLDARCPDPTPLEQGRTRGGRWLLALVLAPMLVAVALLWSEADAAVTTATHTSYALRPCSTCREVPYPDEASCRAAALAEAQRVGLTRTTGGAVYTCMIRANVIATFKPNPTTPSCPPAPAPQTRPGTCPTGTQGNWTQTGTTTYGPAPTCAPTVTWGPVMPPEGACTPIVTEPPIGPRDVPLTWNQGGNLANVRGYLLVYGTSPTLLPRQVDGIPATARSYVVRNLSPGTYYFSLIAKGTCRGTPGSPVDPYVCEDSWLSNITSKVIR
jgi:hypothetical protein